MSFGSIEIICGPMFSGKTSELMRRLERLDYAGKKYLLIKPLFDNRYSTDEVVSHSKKAKKSICVNTAQEILIECKKNKDINIVAIDEAQFFDPKEKINLFDVCLELQSNGYRIIINGLDMDSDGKPFGLMPNLMAVSSDVEKMKAICMFPGCGKDAQMSFKYSNVKKENQKENVVELGESDKYEARCLLHWLLGQTKK
jgi:thymidine kinase